MSKLTNEELIARMHQARAFQDPIVSDFLDIKERDLFDKWRHPATNKEEREELYKLCQGLEAFRKFVKDTITAGHNAEIDLATKNKGNK